MLALPLSKQFYYRALREKIVTLEKNKRQGKKAVNVRSPKPSQASGSPPVSRDISGK